MPLFSCPLFASLPFLRESRRTHVGLIQPTKRTFTRVLHKRLVTAGATLLFSSLALSSRNGPLSRSIHYLDEREGRAIPRLDRGDLPKYLRTKRGTNECPYNEMKKKREDHRPRYFEITAIIRNNRERLKCREIGGNNYRGASLSSYSPCGAPVTYATTHDRNF